jgi:hypothetical protein
VPQGSEETQGATVEHMYQLGVLTLLSCVERSCTMPDASRSQRRLQGYLPIWMSCRRIWVIINFRIPNDAADPSSEAR